MSKILIVGDDSNYGRRTQMIINALSQAGHEIVYEMPDPKPLAMFVDEWNMVNGSTINFSEIGRIDNISYFPNEDLMDWYDNGIKPLTQPAKKGTMNEVLVQPSKLLVKLIGRIYED